MITPIVSLKITIGATWLFGNASVTMVVSNELSNRRPEEGRPVCFLDPLLV